MKEQKRVLLGQKQEILDPSKQNINNNLDPPEFCNFCGKGPGEYTELITGPGVGICNECVNKCNQELEIKKEESR